MLKMRGVAMCLECKMHKQEEQIVENRVVTIATNMAGRGTDIKLF
jgi:preprotein translocase subunit SecA